MNLACVYNDTEKRSSHYELSMSEKDSKLEALCECLQHGANLVLISSMPTESLRIGWQSAVKRLNWPHRTTLRAPHHTVSGHGLSEEFNIAIGGIVYLDMVHEFSTSALNSLTNSWFRYDRMTNVYVKNLRPILILDASRWEEKPLITGRSDPFRRLLDELFIRLNRMDDNYMIIKVNS